MLGRLPRGNSGRARSLLALATLGLVVLFFTAIPGLGEHSASLTAAGGVHPGVSRPADQLPPIVGFATNGGFALPYYVGLFTDNPISAGGFVFADDLQIQFINLQSNRTISVTTIQTYNDSGGGHPLYGNLTFDVPGSTESTLSFTLPSSTAVSNTKLCLDGGCIRFYHVTPVTLLSIGFLDVGGLDLVAASLTLEAGVGMGLLTAAAYVLQRKAQWAPRFPVWLILPHIALGFVLFLSSNYYEFEILLGGWSFLGYPIIAASLWFWWVLHLFNVASTSLVLKADPQGGEELAYNYMKVAICTLSDRSKSIVGRRWRDWFARLLGHQAVIWDPDLAKKLGRVAESNVIPFSGVRPRTSRLGEPAIQKLPIEDDPFDRFDLRGGDMGSHVALRERDYPRKLFWIDSDRRWSRIELPKLVWHKDVPVPERVTLDGVTIPAHTRPRLSFPHYTDPRSQSDLLGAIHHYDMPALTTRWTSDEIAWKANTSLRMIVAALRSSWRAEASREVEIRVAEDARLSARDVEPISDSEVADLTRSEWDDETRSPSAPARKSKPGGVSPASVRGDAG